MDAAGVLGDWRHTLEAVSLILLVTVALYLTGGCIDGKDYRPADGEEEVEPAPVKVTIFPAGSKRSNAAAMQFDKNHQQNFGCV